MRRESDDDDDDDDDYDDDDEDEDEDEDEDDEESLSLSLLLESPSLLLLVLGLCFRFFCFELFASPSFLFRPTIASILSSYSRFGSGGSSPVKSANFCFSLGFFNCCVRDGRDTYARSVSFVEHSYVQWPT